MSNNGDGTSTAYFGYTNLNPVAVAIPVGSALAGMRNEFSGNSKDRGQPSSFNSGTVQGAVAVQFSTNGSISWTLQYLGTALGVATANSNTPACIPIVPRGDCVSINADGSLSGHFGYRNMNPFPISIPVGSNNGFTPGAVDRGQPTLFIPGNLPNVFSVDFSDQIGWLLSGQAAQVTKNSPSCTPNDAPNCNAGGAYQTPCQGTLTKITLDGSASSDPNNNKLFYSWTTTCNGTFDNAASARPQLTLTDPGNGKRESCTVSLTVSDGLSSSSCSASLDAEQCIYDCAGTPGGDGKVDICGVCNGDGKSCLDCAGVPFGSKKLDKCGVCDGTDACLDCAGMPNGPSKKDSCGVCNGDDSSCLGCSQTDIAETQLVLDGEASSQAKIVRLAAQRLSKFGDTKAKSFAQGATNKAKDLYLKNWRLSYSLPSKISNCTNMLVCEQVDGQAGIDEYLANAKKLRDLTKNVVARLAKFVGKRGVDMRLLRDAERFYNEAQTNIAAVPRFRSVCTKPAK